MKKSCEYFLLVFLLHICCQGCKKQDTFLEAKPSDDLLVPATVEDCRMVLMNEGVLNAGSSSLGTLSADEYSVKDNIWQIGNIVERNAYSWAKDIYEGNNDFIWDWSLPYNQVYYSNVVLEALEKIDEKSQAYNTVKGAALFFRSFAFYTLVQTFAKPYDAVTAGKDAGIVLRLTTDLNVKFGRASIQDCYNQIVKDLETALSLLPLNVSSPTWPCKPAAAAMLSRVYLGMSNYKKVVEYATICLKDRNRLTNYNSLNITDNAINDNDRYLEEDIFHITSNSYLFLLAGSIDTSLYNQYDENDIRKKAFFFPTPGRILFKGTYDIKKRGLFCGLAVDEVLLDRAEALTRTGDVEGAKADLNKLLKNRWKDGTYNDIVIDDPKSLLKVILSERKKELIYRGTRWTDLRRLNKEPEFAVVLKRNIKGNISLLPPSSSRYAMQIPTSEVLLNNIQQNER